MPFIFYLFFLLFSTKTSDKFVWEVAEDNEKNTKPLFFFPFTAHMQYNVIVFTVLLTFNQTGKWLSAQVLQCSDQDSFLDQTFSVLSCV